MAADDLVDVCTNCRSVKKFTGTSREWHGSNNAWGDSCSFCGAPVITCRRDQIDEAYESGQRP